MVKNIVERLLNMPVFLETPGDAGAGGGGGTGDANPGTVNDGTTKPGAGDGTKKPDTSLKPGPGGNGSGISEAQYKGVLADLKKEREARQKWERDHGTAAAELERERKRVRALSGLDNPSPEEADEAAIRQRLETMYPWLKDLTSEDIKAIKESSGNVKALQDASVHQWKAHATKMLGSVTSGVQKALGGGKLSDRQVTRIQTAYAEEVRSNADSLARHEAGDQTFVDEFIKGWLDDFVEPGRRSALQQETLPNRRPRVPGGKDRSIVGADDKPIDVKDDKAVGDLLVKGFRERGGQFGRR